MNTGLSVLIGLSIVTFGAARLTGGLPRWWAGPIPRWFGLVDVVFGLSIIVWALGAEWVLNVVWVFGAFAIGALFLTQLLRAFRGAREWRARKRSEDERLRAALEQKRE